MISINIPKRYTRPMVRLTHLAAIAALFAAACSDDDAGAPDATPMVDAPPAIDADSTDAAPPDAGGPCDAGEAFFTGAYEDWDSTDMDFLGIFDATYTELGNKTNTASTAPNGRVELCVTANADTAFSITHATYLDAVLSMDAEANAAGPFAINGMTPARADELFTQIGLTRDTLDAQVIVAVQMHPEETPVIGAQVSIDGNANEGAFVADANNDYSAGDTTTDGAFVLFANTEVGAGTTTVTVTPPNGVSCVGVTSMSLTAGELAFAPFACSTD